MIKRRGSCTWSKERRSKKAKLRFPKTKSRDRKNKSKVGIQWSITIVCVTLLLFMVFFVALKPDEAVER